ncbi:MAG TPA: hypothetical protein VIL09_16015 [Microvirga sp.]
MSLTLNVQAVLRPDPNLVIKRLSTAADGAQGNGNSHNATLTADGRFLVFESAAKNLVVGDINGRQDIFVKDLATGAVTQISATAGGIQGNGDSHNATASADGRFVVFDSQASNLVADDADGFHDVFLKNLATGAITRISSAADGTQGNSDSYNAMVSANERFVVFESFADNLVDDDTNDSQDIFIRDLLKGTITRITATETETETVEANGGSYNPSVSADGRFVVFASFADNLVADDNNGLQDIFLKDLQTQTITRISTALDGTEGNRDSYNAKVSPDGRFVVFESEANNLVAGDTNDSQDIFLKDLQTGAITRVSTAADGTQGNNNSYDAAVSADGRYVVFESEASNLVAGDTNNRQDVFRKDLVTGTITRISAAADGTGGVSSSSNATMSPDGRFVLFDSPSGNLVPGDGNGRQDIFLVDTARLAEGRAIAEGRSVELRLGVGNASSVSLAWGDGTTSTLAPVGGSVAFSHTYASAGPKAALVTVQEAGTTWAVPYLIDLPTGTMTRNAAALSKLTGSKAKDQLTGDAFADRIGGGSGNDVLTGGAGADAFVFDTKLGSAKTDRKVNFDAIRDFNVKDDAIWLENAVFTKLGKGSFELAPKALNKKFFSLDKAKDKNDYIIYDKKKGVLSYDADGSGTRHQAVEFASVTKKLALTHNDFFVI